MMKIQHCKKNRETVYISFTIKDYMNIKLCIQHNYFKNFIISTLTANLPLF